MEAEEVNFSALLNGDEEIPEKYPITDIDKFYKECYNYYIERGYYTILTKLVGKNIFQAISIFFYFIVNLCINWDVVFLNVNKPLLQYPNKSTFWYYFILFSIVILTLQLMASILYSFRYAFYMRKIRYFYNKVFCIEDSSLTFLKWKDIEQQIIHMKNNNKFNFIRKKIEPLSIVKRITRRKNYMILLLQSKYLKNYYISNELFEYIDYAFITFTESYQLDRQYLESKKLYYWLKIISIVNFILIPFKLLYVIILFILTNAESLYTKRDIVGNRYWNEKEFYLYNEYNHLFKNRMNKAGLYMNLWIIKNPNSVIDSILTFVISVSSCIVSLLTPIIVFNSTLSEYIIQGNTVIWHLAFFSTLIILSRKYLLQEQSKILRHEKLKDKIMYYTCNNIGNNVSNNISNNVNETREVTYKNEQVFNPNTLELKLIYKQYLQLYSYTIVIFLKNIYSIFTLPFIFNRLANSYLSIGNYMIRSTVNTEFDGDMCLYSDFENIDVLRSLNNEDKHEELNEKDNILMERSLRLYITRNTQWYNNYKNLLDTKHGCQMLYNIDKTGKFNKFDKGEKNSIKIKRKHSSDSDSPERKDILNYNSDEDNALINSNIFNSSQSNPLEDNSTVLQDNIV